MCWHSTQGEQNMNCDVKVIIFFTSCSFFPFIKLIHYLFATTLQMRIKAEEECEYLKIYLAFFLWQIPNKN